MLNCTTSDMVTRIRNAQMAMLLQTEVIYSSFNMNILKVLKNLRFIKDYKVDETGKFKKLFVVLKYITVGIGSGIGQINVIKRVSKPGRRVYKDLASFKYLSDEKHMILSTNKGIMTAHEAKKIGIGGEVILVIS